MGLWVKELSSAKTKGDAALKRVLDHIDHVLEIAGVEHVGLGSDSGIETGLKGLEDVTKTPYITEGLPRRTYSDDEILKILGGNCLRAFKNVVG